MPESLQAFAAQVKFGYLEIEHECFIMQHPKYATNFDDGSLEKIKQ